MSLSPADIIAQLGLKPHPEGGYYARTYRHSEGPEGRGYGSAIYYLLEGPDFARWHMIDADEMWHWYAGAPLRLESMDADEVVTGVTLGTNLAVGERPQILMPANHWQRACSLGAWTLCGCTVSPGFLFETFRMTEEGGSPTGAK